MTRFPTLALATWLAAAAPAFAQGHEHHHPAAPAATPVPQPKPVATPRPRPQPAAKPRPRPRPTAKPVARPQPKPAAATPAPGPAHVHPAPAAASPAPTPIPSAPAPAAHEHHPADPVAPAAPDHAAMDHAAMGHDPLMQRARTMGSGTSVLPQSSPMRMWSHRDGDWLWMLHGDLIGGLNQQGGTRGSRTWAAENWAMAMGTRNLGPGILDLRAMGSGEAWTLPAGGTPHLFQTGETYQGLPLRDAQHPHDLFMELSGRYTWNLADATRLFVYGGLVGEPALGPVAFMHRPSSADNHWAPLGHHLQDSTHIAMGVATVGLRQGPLQLEGSAFNGREPDERRWDLEFGRFDSWSTRLTWLPHPDWTAQVSYGQLRNPEPAAPGDIHRTSASVAHVRAFPGGYWSSGLVWGQNRELHGEERVLQSYGAEGQLDWAAVNHAYGRLELVDKVGLGADHHAASRVLALTLGGVRDLDASDAFDLGLGADATVYSLDPDLRDAYGFNPVSVRVYLRLRPPTMPDGIHPPHR